jgi:dolichol-phosphate mannosyltransferase
VSDARLISVVLPTRNERDGTVLLVYALLGALGDFAGRPFELVVVDDSSDGSEEYLRERLRRRRDVVDIVHREHGTGLASAIGDGIRRARGEDVLVMDADFNHNPLDVLRLLGASAGADLVIGSRFVRDGAMLGHPLRERGSRLFNQFVRHALGLATRDHLCGFWLAPRAAVVELEGRWPLFYGYGDYFIRLVFAAHLLGWRVREIPVDYLDRLTGESKTRFHVEVFRYTGEVLRLRRGRRALAARLAVRFARG